MATIKNTQARLLVGPTIEGVTARWLPGTQPLDAGYWNRAKQKETVKRWLEAGWLEVNEAGDMAAAAPPPSPEDLASQSDKDLEEALEADDLPTGWAKPIKAELKRRAQVLAEKRTPQAPVVLEAPAPKVETPDGG